MSDPIRTWNEWAAHRIWDRRIGVDAADRLALVRLPAYRALAAFYGLLALAVVVVFGVPGPALNLGVAAAVIVFGLVLVARGVAPMRAEGVAFMRRLEDAGQVVDTPAPLNDGGAFDRWVARNRVDVSALRERELLPAA